MQKSMTSGNSLKLLLTFMVPLIIGNIFQQMYSISDIIMHPWARLRPFLCCW